MTCAFGVARTGEQIQRDMFAPLTGREEGLVALWDFEAGDARDRSTNQFHGQPGHRQNCRSTKAFCG